MTGPTPITAVSLLSPPAAPISSRSLSSLPSTVHTTGRTGNHCTKPATTTNMKSSTPWCSSMNVTSLAVSAAVSPGITAPQHLNIRRRKRTISCEISLESDSTTVTRASSEEAKIGARVRVKVPLKVHHVPRLPEVDLTGMEGELKQYVGLWKGRRISANLPYKVEFLTEIQGRGPVKFFAHLKEDEFEYL
ncbi:hypothetical protein F2P56_033571 [Juglans regia]|uniref:Ferredoxin-thioredoxin reductase, variable chain, chloroplastic n=2 Tax=Juglans regia TaxID=51240 RepID=A0A2I4FXT9_JUGRE|nr:ferredoxin-thioredoxin reductase, variable chain, chloroplastic [Juglans regia]KAF5444440.1 hypothetical protein F2P56_033571 [Juglans regia]